MPSVCCLETTKTILNKHFNFILISIISVISIFLKRGRIIQTKLSKQKGKVISGEMIEMKKGMQKIYHTLILNEIQYSWFV